MKDRSRSHPGFLHIGKKIQILLLLALLGIACLLVYTFWGLPSVDSLPAHLNTPSVRITDRNGRPLYDLLPTEGGRHAVLSFDNIPQCMKDATIAVEDKTFYQNPGVDIVGIIRALWINIQGGGTISGGSTITQQVARNLLLNQNERSELSLRRKLREAVLAWELTRKYSKNDILAFYLNQVNYGGMSYGIEAAAQTYFGKHASDLLLPECALLTGLPQAPGVYNPFTNPDLAKARQKIVLGLMQAQGNHHAGRRARGRTGAVELQPGAVPHRSPAFYLDRKEPARRVVFFRQARPAPEPGGAHHAQPGRPASG